jgi:hypothetical protein
MKPFHTRYFVTIKKQSRQSPDNDFGGLVEIKAKEIKIKLSVPSRQHLVDFALLCY